MNDSNKTYSLFIVFTGFIIALCRFLLDSTYIKTGKSEHILIVMAAVNYIAFGVVVLFLFKELNKLCNEKVTQSGLDTIQKKKCTYIIFVISFILVILYLVFGYIYMLFLKSSGLNDAISIIALSISIATDKLIKGFRNSYYKLVLKISKHKFKR